MHSKHNRVQLFEILLLTPDPAFNENKLHRSFVFSTIRIILLLIVEDRAHGDAHSCNEMFVNKQIFTLLEVTEHLSWVTKVNSHQISSLARMSSRYFKRLASI